MESPNRWTDVGPGATVCMTVLIDDADIELGDPNQEPPANQQPPEREVGEPALYLPAFVR